MKRTFVLLVLAMLLLAEMPVLADPSATEGGFPKLDTPQKAIDAFVHAINTHNDAEMAYATSPPQTGIYAWPDTVTAARIVSQKEMPMFWNEATEVWAK